jgi:hypothetical protein
LTNFECGISPWKSPIEWLHADMNYIDSIIQGIFILTENAEIDEANFAGAMIYQVCSTVLMY